PVDDDTRFCIGSCSKMFAGAVLVSLASEGTVDLDAPVNRWLTGFSAPKLTAGTPASNAPAKRAPTLRELLCHRGGIYTQRNRMTDKQTRWIRDFKLTLTDSVNGIAAEPLVAQPGEQFAYSGAGYCVLGRVAEIAADKPFDELLAIHVTRPLHLSRTTYFPPAGDDNVATGHALIDGKLALVDQTPHRLGKQHKLALIGGSLYAPAREAAEFARMLLHNGKAGNHIVLSPHEWKQMTTPHSPRPDGGYGFGLSLALDRKTNRLQSASHGGALFGSYSFIAVDFRTRRFAVVNYVGRRNAEIGSELQKWVHSAK
ncbi:MAG: hypothetical protein CMJ48_04860, partial [Planctomycetaceae bacterium]|nr:hypothetical protein [Planctomycetaceae bacterium]